MFNVGDAVKTTEACAYTQNGFAVGTVGVITEVLNTEIIPYPYMVNFGGDDFSLPCSAEELELI